MTMNTKTPNATVLNSKWQMAVRKYGAYFTGACWALVLIAWGTAQVSEHQAGVISILCIVVGVICLAFDGLILAVKRNSSDDYSISEWSRAVRELHGPQAAISLNPDQTVIINANGEIKHFSTLADAIRLPVTTAIPPQGVVQ